MTSTTSPAQPDLMVGQWVRVARDGGPHLPATRLTRDHRVDVARARRVLGRQLRADRALLADLIAHGEPAAAMARAVATLEELEKTLTVQTRP